MSSLTKVTADFQRWSVNPLDSSKETADIRYIKDLMQHVFRYSLPSELAIASSICKSWALFASAYTLWRPTNPRLFLWLKNTNISIREIDVVCCKWNRLNVEHRISIPWTNQRYAEEVKNFRLVRNKVLAGTIIIDILSFLSPEGLCSVSCLNKNYNKPASNVFFWKAFNVKKLFPTLKVFDMSDWSRYDSFDASDAPLQNKEMIKTLKRFTSLQAGKDLEFTLLTVPGTLSVKRLKGFMSHTQPIYIGNADNASCFAHYEKQFSKKIIQEIPIKETYRVLIIKGSFQGTENLSMDEKVDLFKLLGCELPTFYEIFAHVFSSKSYISPSAQIVVRKL